MYNLLMKHFLQDKITAYNIGETITVRTDIKNKNYITQS